MGLAVKLTLPACAIVADAGSMVAVTLVPVKVKGILAPGQSSAAL